MNDEYIKASMERDRRGFREDVAEVRKDAYSEAHKECRCEPPQNDCCCEPKFDCNEPCQDDNGFGSWLPILILIFLLCGGTGTFFGGGGGCGDRGDCCDNNSNGGFWIIILLVIFFIWNNNQGGGCKDGFFGGLF